MQDEHGKISQSERVAIARYVHSITVACRKKGTQPMRSIPNLLDLKLCASSHPVIFIVLCMCSCDTDLAMSESKSYQVAIGHSK